MTFAEQKQAEEQKIYELIHDEESLVNRLRGCAMQLKNQHCKFFAEDLEEAADLIEELQNQSSQTKSADKVICVIQNGAMIEAYSNNPETDIELLDYDSYNKAEEGTDEYKGFQCLEEEIGSGKYAQVW